MRRVWIQSGEVAFCRDPAVIHTVVGVCMAVCLWDVNTGAGAMCHYVLPRPIEGTALPRFAYGSSAIAHLLDQFDRAGSKRSHLRAKLVGGAEVGPGNARSGEAVGEKNLATAMVMLKEHSIPVVGRSVGGEVGRRVKFRSDTGELRFQTLATLPAAAGSGVQNIAAEIESRPPAESGPWPKWISSSPADVLEALAVPPAVLGQWLIVVGSSTGGVQALEAVLRELPTTIPPLLIVQHIPADYTQAFARRLDGACAAKVEEATDGVSLRPGCIYLAPGDCQMKVLEGRNGELRARITEDPPENGFAPSVDYLFRSAALVRRRKLIGVLLTGMGVDGAKGLLTLRDAGAVTIAQDEQSSVVYGMPRRAIELGAVDRGTPLQKIATRIVVALRGGQGRRPRRAG